MSDWYKTTFSAILTDIDLAIRQFINQHPHQAPIFWQQVYEHFDYQYPDALQDPNPSAAGKRVRPLLMCLVARSLQGDYAHIMPGAVALEIIHNFTLIHDDIMDQSDMRRGRTTVWKNYGIAQAIDSGDGLFALGMLSSLQLEQHVPAERALRATQLLIQACLDTVEGQALDISFETRLDVTPDEYLTMIHLKTGRFIETAIQIGALLSTEDAATITAYGDFGNNLGLAFQMWDDYLGIWGDPEVIGKSASGDIEQKKKSYPITYAFTHGTPQQIAQLRVIYQQEHLSETDVQAVRDILAQLGVRDTMQALVDQYYEAAMTALTQLTIDNADTRNLKQLAEFIIQRTY